MICRLCLDSLNNSMPVPIFICDSKQHPGELARMISKYLALELSPYDNVSTSICQFCYNHLEDFHQFWMLVDQKQRTLQNQQPYEFFSVHLMSNSNEIEKDENDTNPETLKEEILKMELDPVCDNDGSLHSDIKGMPSDELWKPNCDVQSTKTSSKSFPKKAGNKLKSTKKTKKREKSSQDKHDYLPISSNENIIENVDLICELCDDHVGNFEQLKKHFESFHSEEQPYFKCCKKKFIGDSVIADHLKSHNTSKMLTCPVCEKSFFSRKSLNVHIRSRHEDAKAFQCHICQKGYQSQKYCESHVQSHNGEKKVLINCDKCKRSFTSMMRLKRHCRIMHVAVYPYKCQACEEKFLTKKDVETHQDFCKNRTVLKEDKQVFRSVSSNLICEICCKIFANSNRLRKHIDFVHKNIHPYVCDQCGRKFKFKPTFEKHLLQHDGIVEPPAQCQICGKWLKHKNSLRLHLYAHDNSVNKCELCNHVAPTRSALRNHVKKKHRLEREYQCKYCDKSFKDSKSQEEHIATHTGAQLYSCPHCPKETRSSSNMYAHVKRMHPQEWLKAKLARSHDPIAKTNLGALVS